MKQINHDIKTGEFSQIYLLYGEEAYLKKMYRDKLHEAMVDSADTMNYSYFEGKNSSITEIIDLAETLPFFAERRLIVIENSGFFKKASPELADYLKTAPETTFFLFVENEVDKRGKLFKTVKSKGYAAVLDAQDEKTLMNWILSMLNKENKKISRASMELLLTKTGSDMSNIEKELEKLICYTMGRDIINSEDIEMICTGQITNQIFDMINAIAEKQQKRALELYYDLLTLKEPPMRILFLIARQFQILLQVKSLQSKGYDKNTIGKKIGLHSFIASKYMAQARHFTKEQLLQAVSDCVETETDVKTGRMNDIISVELLIVKYSKE